jgi:hypothetical protein
VAKANRRRKERGTEVLSRTELAAVALWALASTTACCQEPKPDTPAKTSTDVVLENDYVRYVLGADGRNLSFIDKRTGKQHRAPQGDRPFMILKKGDRQFLPTACTYADGEGAGVRGQESGVAIRTGTLRVQFQQPDVTALLKVTCKRHYFIFEVNGLSDPNVEQVALLNLAVAPSQYVSGMSGVAADDEFATCVRALNLQVRPSVGGTPAEFSAVCYRQYAIPGARLALVGCPKEDLRPVLKEVVRGGGGDGVGTDRHVPLAEPVPPGQGLPWSPLGGPYALDAEENRGSYVFAGVSQQNVPQWIELAKKAGIAEIHFIGWERSLGHYHPREDLFPDGLAGLRATVEKIHGAGLKAGMHTLTGCIAPHDPWITPVPDKRLAADATFTLAAPLDQRQTTVLTDQQPGDFDTVWAYGARGNVLRIDEELIQFGGLSRKPPYGFTHCRRGAFGTKPALHENGARADHLFVRYGCFQPDPNSTLVDDVAAAIAEVFNTCGFDMIYMDGAEGTAGGWHGEAQIRKAIFQKLKRPALVEASSWGHHSWPFHSRIGAWDYPNWGLKQFIDVHCRANEAYRKSTLLPAQLGWWAIFGPDRNRDAELPDEIEYLCTKALAYDMPMSFQAVEPGDRPQNARQDEYLTMIGQYERLRLAGYFPEAVRQRLRRAGEQFRLVRSPAGIWQFVPADYAAHKVTGSDDGTEAWTVNNRFAGQPVKLRIQALYCAEPYDAPQSRALADFRSTDEFTLCAAAPGVTCALSPSEEQVKVGGTSGCYSAINAGSSRRGAWTRAGKSFAPEANIDPYDALGVWIHGDGKGELLNLQLTSPPQYYEALDEHYVQVDFQGWRYFELLLRERDAGQYGDHVWPYEGHYAVYRAPLVRSHVSELNLYFNNLPPRDGVTCFLSPIKALKVRKATLRNPSVQVGGRRVVFPVALESGAYLELESPSDCRLYDERGALVRQLQPEGEVPALAAGENRVKFTCEGPEGLRGRAKVTVISYGELFGRKR